MPQQFGKCFLSRTLRDLGGRKLKSDPGEERDLLIRNIRFLVDIIVFHLPWEWRTEVDFGVIMCMHWFDSGSLCVWTMKVCEISVWVCNGFAWTFYHCGLANHGGPWDRHECCEESNPPNAFPFLPWLWIQLVLFLEDFHKVKMPTKPKFATQKEISLWNSVCKAIFIRLGFSPLPGHGHLQDEEA